MVGVHLIIVGSQLRRYVNLLDVPRTGDVLWVDTDSVMPSLTKFYVRKVEWFQRYNGDEPGVVLTCSDMP